MKLAHLQVLDKNEIDDIHSSTLTVLHEVGLKFLDDPSLKIFNQAGAEVDFKNQLVKIPPYLVEEMVKKAPRKFTLHARDPKNDLPIDDHRSYFGTGNALNILEGKESRHSSIFGQLLLRLKALTR